MWPLKSILCFVLLWGGWFGALVNPIWGVASYILIYQVDPISKWWGEPLTALGLRYSLFAMLFTVVGMIVARKNVPRVYPGISMWECGIAVLVLCGIMNIFLGVRWDPWAQFVFEKFWKLMVFVIVLGRLATTRQNLRWVMWTFILGSLYLGHNAYTAPSWAFAHGRLEGVGGPDFNSTSGLAAHLASMLPLIGVMFLSLTHWKWRLLAMASGLFTCNAIVMCRTRSAFVGLAAGALVALLTAPATKRFRIHLCLIIGAFGAYHLTDNHFWARMSTLKDREELIENDMATRARVEIWKVSMQIIADYPTGVGVGNFPYVIGKYDARYYKRASHNTVVLCFVELGVQGGVIFLLLIGGSLWHVRECARLAPESDNPLETKLLSYGTLISLVTYVVCGLGTERLYCESYWWVLALPMCLHRVVLGEIHAREPVPAQSDEFLDFDGGVLGTVGGSYGAEDAERPLPTGRSPYYPYP
jgi:putative inorganic carbon (HCO3(-)) transporter